MTWRKISEGEIENAVRSPDKLEPSERNRMNAYKALGNRLLKVTYSRQGDTIMVVTAVWKGE
jgi:hypothetical protein